MKPHFLNQTYISFLHEKVYRERTLYPEMGFLNCLYLMTWLYHAYWYDVLKTFGKPQKNCRCMCSCFDILSTGNEKEKLAVTKSKIFT